MPKLLDGLDAIYTKLAPEFGAVDLPVEGRATCLSCAMAPKPGADPDKPWSFTDKRRCCTYHPAVPNHLVGRILRRGDRGSERMRARIAEGGGISPYAVGPTREWNDRYAAGTIQMFGRAEDIPCPYWVDEPHACTIWRDRNAVCRTWFCKHEDGGRGRDRWSAAREAIAAVDKTVAAYLVRLGDPPGANARPGEWYGWFRWCAERVDLFDATDLATVRTPVVQEALARFLEVPAPEVPLPDVVVPSLLEWHRTPGAVFATAYSLYDLEELPAGLFGFLARLDGVLPWRDALGDGVDEATVHRMWRRGLLAAPESGFVAGSSTVSFGDGPWADVPELQEQIVAAFQGPIAKDPE